MASRPADQEAYEYTMHFVGASDRQRTQFISKWQEVEMNFMVDASQNLDYGERTPYHVGRVYRSPKNRIILKDPETHKLVMTYASKLVRALFGDSRHEYVRAEPVGLEDVQKAQSCTRLLRYCFGLPGHFRTFVEGIIDMLLFGTAVVEVGWRLDEREMPVRTVNTLLGEEHSTETRTTVPIYDDVTIRTVDIMDFFPDPSRYRIQEMTGCAKRFRMNEYEARRMVSAGIYDAAAVEQALRNTGGNNTGSDTAMMPSFRKGLTQPATTYNVASFKEMIGYEYYGCAVNDSDGSKRDVYTVLNGVTVRNKPYQFADNFLPFHALIINPIQGRFWGISPAEVIRFDQSFADALKILIAEAVIRGVHPPIAFDPDADVDVGAIKAWKADALIAAKGGPNAVGTLKYDANLVGAYNTLNALKNDIQGGSGSLGSLEGQPGPDREAASVGMQRYQMAMDRPELAAMLLENECLPPIAQAVLSRYQQYLTSEDLAKRIGQQPRPTWIGDVLGDFDIKFMGSRMVGSRQLKLQAFDRIMNYARVSPAFQAILPNQEIAEYVVNDLLELPEVAAAIGNPQSVMQNLALTKMMGMMGAPGAQGGQQGGGLATPQPAAPQAQMMGNPTENVQ